MNEELTGIFNVAYGKKMTINNLAESITSLTGSKSQIKHQSERSGDVKHSLASIEKLLSIGLKPTFDFNNGLDKTIEFFKKQI